MRIILAKSVKMALLNVIICLVELLHSLVTLVTLGLVRIQLSALVTLQVKRVTMILDNDLN